jgi:undecaprenyl-diphosphatase
LILIASHQIRGNKFLEQININIFSAINQFAGHNLLIDNSAIIAAEYLPYLFILPLIYLWFRQKENSRDYALFAVYSAVIGLTLNLVITLIYFHPRPFMEGLGHTLFNHAAETSFPSDHTTAMLSLAIILLFFKPTRILGGTLAVLGFITGLARVFCGIHFPFDILGSLLVATASAGIVWVCRGQFVVVNKFIINLYIKLFSQQTNQ